MGQPIHDPTGQRWVAHTGHGLDVDHPTAEKIAPNDRRRHNRSRSAAQQQVRSFTPEDLEHFPEVHEKPGVTLTVPDEDRAAGQFPWRGNSVIQNEEMWELFVSRRC